MNSVHSSVEQTFVESYGGTCFPYQGNMELQSGNRDLLDDITSLIDMRNAACEYADSEAFHLTGAASQINHPHPGHQDALMYGGNQFHHYGNQTHTHIPAGQQPVTSLEERPTSPEEKDMSQYALNAIFKSLIYPDVCQGHFMTFDSLVQTVPSESRPNTNAHSNSKYIRTVNCDQRSHHQQVKRKRSRDVSCDEDYLKRRRY